MLVPLDVNNRTLTDEITAGSVKTTYVGVCQTDGALATTTAQAVWKITKYIATTSGGTITTLQYWPTTAAGKCDRQYDNIWDNRAALTYV